MNDHIKRILAHTQAVDTKHRDELEQAEQLIALPGVRVRVIRWPWQVGLQGTVMGVDLKHYPRQASVDFDGNSAVIPLSAIARLGTDVDCDTAQIRHTAAYIKKNAGEFLD